MRDVYISMKPNNHELIIVILPSEKRNVGTQIKERLESQLSKRDGA